jgi:hypothetical protein
MARVVVLLSCLLLAAAACSKGKEAEAPGTPPASGSAQLKTKPQPKAPVDFSGVLKGIVKLVPGAELPLAPDLGSKAANLGAPCPPYGPADRQIVSMAPETRGLSPAHVAITQMTDVPEHKPVTVDLYIDGCRLGPKLVGVTRDDSIKITNRSELQLLPLLPGDSFLTGIPKGGSRSVKMTRLGPTNIRCGIAGYCGDAMVITLSHSLFAVTDAKGEFVIRNVPLNQELKVHGAHPMIGVTNASFKLTKQKPEATVELVLTPKTAPAPAAEAPKEPAADPKAKKPAGKLKGAAAAAGEPALK